MQEASEKNPNKALALIFLTVALDLIGFGIILPVLPLYAKNLGASAQMIGVLFASFSVMHFLFAPYWGRLSDRIGRRPVLLLGILGNVIALSIFAFAPSFVWLLVARIFSGMCTANISVANAYIADIMPAEKRAKGMGVIGAAFGLGFVIGPMIGGELSVYGTFAAPLFAAALSLINFVGAFFWLPESLAKEHRAQAFHKNALRLALAEKGAMQILVLVFFQVLAFSMLEMAFVLFAERRLHFAAQQSGRMFMYIGLVLVLVQGGMIGPLVKRFGERRLVIVGLSSIALGMLLIPFTPENYWPAFVVYVTLVAFGQALTAPSLSSLLSRKSSISVQGVVSGASQSMSALARVIGPCVAGILFQMLSEDAPFYAGGLLTATITAWALTQLFTERS